MTPSPAAFAAIGLALILMAVPATGPATAQDPELRANNPIPGVDVVVKKRPSGTALVIVTTGSDGRFSGRARVEQGQYEVSTACSSRAPCAPHRLASVSVDGRRLRPDARGAFVFPVGPRTGAVMLAGMIVGAPAAPRPPLARD